MEVLIKSDFANKRYVWFAHLNFFSLSLQPPGPTSLVRKLKMMMMMIMTTTTKFRREYCCLVNTFFWRSFGLLIQTLFSMTGKFTITTGSGSRKSERIHMNIQIRDNNINFIIVRKDHTEKNIIKWRHQWQSFKEKSLTFWQKNEERRDTKTEGDVW